MKKIWIQKALSLKSLAAQHWLQTAWCVVGFKNPDSRKHTDTEFTHAPVHARDILSWSCRTHLGVYACKIVCKICTKYLHTCIHWSLMHKLHIQVPDYSWGVHASTPAGMHLITSACPECRRLCILTHRACTYMCTLTICLWTFIFWKEKGRVLFLGIIFLGDVKKHKPMVSTLLYYRLLRYLQSLLFQLASKYQSCYSISGTCTCQPLLLRLEFSWDGLECFLELSLLNGF